MSTDDDFGRSVFVNCPFDEDYDHILQAVLFCLVRFGLKPRIATERSDAGESRFSKIVDLIHSSKYSIHDLSRCQAQRKGEHYRLNMPFELGLDYGCRQYGGGRLSTKVFLILEEERYRYQASISDLAGFDIEAHKGNYEIAVRKVRKWLAGMTDFEEIGTARILGDYEDFQEWYLQRNRNLGLSEGDIRDYATDELLRAMVDWRESHLVAPADRSRV